MLENGLLQTLAGNGIFAAMLTILWKYSTDKIGIKDNDLKELNNKVLTAFQEQSRTNAMLSTSIDNNTKAVEGMGRALKDNGESVRALNDKIYDVLTKHG